MAPTTVLFDLDGTLLNTLEDLWLSCNWALAQAGRPQRTLDEVRRFVGDGMLMLVKRAAGPQATEEEAAALLASLKEHYALHGADHTAPYPGISRLLGQLHNAGVSVGVVSNKADEAVGALVGRYFGGLVDVCVGEREAAGIPRKPSPAMVRVALERLGASVDEAVYVGDSSTDVQTAHAAGIPCIGVSWGFRGRQHLEACGADAIADTVEELGRLILDTDADLTGAGLS